MFSFLFQGALFDVVLNRLSSLEDAVGGVCSVRSYLGILPAKGAGSAPGASRAPPAPLEPLSFLAARGVLCRRLRRRFRGGACPAVSKDHLNGGPRPCSTRLWQPFRFRWLVSAVRCAVVGRCLSWRPLGLSCRVRAKTILSLTAEGLLAGRFLATPLSGDGFGGGVDRCDFGFAVDGGGLSRTRIFLVAGRRAAGP